MVKERNYGVDLLRLVLMFMVCMLHTLGQGGILYTREAGTLSYKAYWFLEIFSYCAVDGFAIISGYMATDKPRKYEKLVEMWFQAFFYSFIVTLILTIIGINKSFGKAEIIECALPVVYGKFWYFTAYFALFFAIPVLNKFIFEIDENIAKKALIIIFVLFSFGGVIADPFKLQGGYSAIWLMVLYCMGALARKIKLFETKKNITLIILWACCIFLTWGVFIFKGNNKLVNYVSPTILLSAIIMVILFSRLRIKGTIISKLSPLAFGIYLFQLNQVIWSVIIKDAVVSVVDKNVIVEGISVFGFASLLFVSGLIVEYIRSRIAAWIRIPSLSKKIVSLIDQGLTKLFYVLK